jgi:hypothetical protein
MSASITEIASNAAQAARVAQQGMAVAERTNSQVAELGTASAEIGDDTTTIASAVEEQTHRRRGQSHPGGSPGRDKAGERTLHRRQRFSSLTPSVVPPG